MCPWLDPASNDLAGFGQVISLHVPLITYLENEGLS